MANWHQDEGARPPARAVYSVNGNMRIEKKWQDINMHINADFMFCVGVMKQSNLYDVENRIQNSAFYRAALPALREAATQFMDAWRCKVRSLFVYKSLASTYPAPAHHPNADAEDPVHGPGHECADG